MKSLYVTSVERYSGKTALCLGLGKRFQEDGYKVGYLKPLSLQPWRIGSHIADEDAAFVKEMLNLKEEPWELSPVVATSEYLHERLDKSGELDQMSTVRQAIDQIGQDKDILLLEGGGSMREGYVFGLPTPVVASTFGSHVLMIVKYRDDVRVLDDALASQKRLGESLAGILINRVPAEAAEFVQEKVIPYLEGRAIRVFGMLPEVRSLAALTVEDLVDLLDADVLNKGTRKGALVENLTVGAMQADAALSRFRKQTNKAVITGGDRTDIQLAALETSTTCLVLTGNLRPSPLVVRQAEEFGVAVLLVPTNTLETVEKIENVFGKTRLGQPEKFSRFQALLADNIDLRRLYESIGLA
ncbi:MAG TPA: phosphotransacetylase family protein [Anaerolineales bacterium]|nr:phosphotransacetylase family protein [Anaerolineales bacterium]